jgi:hypothetical protein
MNTIIQLFIIGLIFGISGFFIGKHRQRWLENVGESAVRNVLLKYLPGPNYHLMNNITLPFEDGTTQIDHILVSRYGIFVIETKHYKGWIFGDEKSHKWTQVIYHYKSTFINPIHQNFKHMVAIRNLLDFIPQDNIHPIVVFTGEAEFKTICPNGVMDIFSLPDYIKDFKEIVLTENRMQFCVGRIETTRKIISKETDIEHQEYLINKHYNRPNWK